MSLISYSLLRDEDVLNLGVHHTPGQEKNLKVDPHGQTDVRKKINIIMVVFTVLVIESCQRITKNSLKEEGGRNEN